MEIVLTSFSAFCKLILIAIRGFAMKKKKDPIKLFAICIAFVFLTACQSYQRQVIPFKMPSAYPNATEVAGATVAVKMFSDSKEAEAVYGFDIIGSGVFPVQVIFDNKGSHSIEILPGQTLLIDVDDNIWPVLDANLAYERIANKTKYGEVVPKAARGGFFAGIAGAMIGAAVGIVTGTNVGTAVLQGAAIGAAAGATAGGAAGLFDKDAQDKIREDLQKGTLENKAVPAQQIAYGFIFFPGEAAKAKELRLRIREVDNGNSHAVVMKFQ
jgi:hypothetical protein